MVDYQKLAEAIGVELGDVFSIVDERNGGGDFYITQDAIFVFNNHNWKWVDAKTTNLYAPQNLEIKFWNFITNRNPAGKLIFACSEPNNGDKYWSYIGANWLIREFTWVGSIEDLARKNTNTVFANPRHALHNRPYVYKKTTGKEWTNG